MKIDKRGYPRDEDGRLVHRKVAYKKYKRDKSKHNKPFGKYQVHHKDGNKKNFRSHNLEILTPSEHRDTHGISHISDYSHVAGIFAATYSLLLCVALAVFLYYLGLRVEIIVMVPMVMFFIIWYFLVALLGEDFLVYSGIVWALAFMIGVPMGSLKVIIWIFAIGNIAVFFFTRERKKEKKKKRKKIFWIVGIIILLFLGIGLYSYNNLPNKEMAFDKSAVNLSSKIIQTEPPEKMIVCESLCVNYGGVSNINLYVPTSVLTCFCEGGHAFLDSRTDEHITLAEVQKRNKYYNENRKV